MKESVDVILLRSADEPDPYVEAFRETGLRATCVPVLTFRFPNQRQLERRLEERDRYAGLIATSPRVAEALDRAFATNDELSTLWGGAPAYVVGPKTAERLRNAGLRPRGMDAGTAEALADQIVEEAPNGLLLFLSGNRRRDVLPNRLEASEIPFDELTVYETRTRSSLDLPTAEGRTWLSFFSPSGLEAVQTAPDVDVAPYCVAAIGPTTAATLEDEGVSVEAVAPEPSPDGLAKAIREADG